MKLIKEITIIFILLVGSAAMATLSAWCRNDPEPDFASAIAITALVVSVTGELRLLNAVRACVRDIVEDIKKNFK